MLNKLHVYAMLTWSNKSNNTKLREQKNFLVYKHRLLRKIVLWMWCVTINFAF